MRRRRVGRRRVRACTITSPARGNCGGRGENGAKISSRTAGFVTRSHYAQGQQSHSPIGSIAATVRVDFEAKISVWNDNGQCLLSVSSYALRDNLGPGSESSSDSRENRRPPHAHHTARAARAVLPLPPLPSTVRLFQPPSAAPPVPFLPLLPAARRYCRCQPRSNAAATFRHCPPSLPLPDTVCRRRRCPSPSACMHPRPRIAAPCATPTPSSPFAASSNRNSCTYTIVCATHQSRPRRPSCPYLRRFRCRALSLGRGREAVEGAEVTLLGGEGAPHQPPAAPPNEGCVAVAAKALQLRDSLEPLGSVHRSPASCAHRRGHSTPPGPQHALSFL